MFDGFRVLAAGAVLSTVWKTRSVAPAYWTACGDSGVGLARLRSSSVSRSTAVRARSWASFCSSVLRVIVLNWPNTSIAAPITSSMSVMATSRPTSVTSPRSDLTGPPRCPSS